MVGHLNPLVTEAGLAEVLDRLVDEQAPHLGSCPKDRVHVTSLPYRDSHCWPIVDRQGDQRRVLYAIIDSNGDNFS